MKYHFTLVLCNYPRKIDDLTYQAFLHAWHGALRLIERTTMEDHNEASTKSQILALLFLQRYALIRLNTTLIYAKKDLTCLETASKSQIRVANQKKVSALTSIVMQSVVIRLLITKADWTTYRTKMHQAKSDIDSALISEYFSWSELWSHFRKSIICDPSLHSHNSVSAMQFTIEARSESLLDTFATEYRGVYDHTNIIRTLLCFEIFEELRELESSLSYALTEFDELSCDYVIDSYKRIFIRLLFLKCLLYPGDAQEQLERYSTLIHGHLDTSEQFKLLHAILDKTQSDAVLNARELLANNILKYALKMFETNLSTYITAFYSEVAKQVINF